MLSVRRVPPDDTLRHYTVSVCLMPIHVHNCALSLTGKCAPLISKNGDICPQKVHTSEPK